MIEIIDAIPKQAILNVCSNLNAAIARGNNQLVRVPIEDICLDICNLFAIPLLPGESASKVAFDKLAEYRHAIRTGMIYESEYAVLILPLESIYRQLNNAIAAHTATLETLKKQKMRRKK